MALRFIACGLLIAVLVAVPSVANAQRLVLLVRHAERADGGVVPAGMTTPADPDLSAEGRARAERLAAMLEVAGVTKIVTSQYKRTQQTAQPLALKLDISPERIPSTDASGLAARLRSFRTDIVLVVGHSNSIPAIITAMGGPRTTIGDTEYGDLFVFVPATGTLTRIKY